MSFPYVTTLTYSTIGNALSTSSNWISGIPNGRSTYYVGRNPGGGTPNPSGIEDAVLVASNSQISLNGAGNVPLNQLPIGFNLAGGFLGFQNSAGGAAGALLLGSAFIGGEFVKMISSCSIPGGGTFTNVFNGPASGAQSIPAPNLSFSYGLVNELFQPWSFELIVQSASDKGSSIIDQHIIATGGFYNIILSTYILTNLTNPSLPPGTYIPGDVFKLTSPNPPNDFDFSTILSVLFGGVTLTIIIQNNQFIEFKTPPPPPPTFPPLTITSTQFTGDAFIAALSPIFSNGTGVYQLTPGQLHDTIYVNSATGNSTVNIARPNVFGKTGFVGG